jgi:FAD/FMN-containing dehydrogenase
MVKASIPMESKLFVRTPSLFESLTKLLDGDLDCSLQTLSDYSTDGSPYQIHPQVIIYPKNTTGIKHIISFAKEYGMPITVAGGRTGGSGGALGEGIIIDLTRHFTTVRSIHIMENTVTVETGVTLKKLQETLHARNMEIPLLEGSDDSSTVGGLVATLSATSSSFHYGSIREWIEGLTVVVDTGEEHHIRDGITPSGRLLGIYQSLFPLLTESAPILRASKPNNKDDATGYNLWSTSIGPRQLIDQLLGSEGTLGILSSVTFRITARVKHSITIAIQVLDLTTLSKYVELSNLHKVTSLYFYDIHSQSLLNRFHPELSTENLSPYTLLVTHRNDDIAKLHSAVTTWKRALGIKEEVMKTLQEKDAFLLQSSGFRNKLIDSYTNGSQTIISTAEGIVTSESNYNELLKNLEDYLSDSGKLYTLTGYRGSYHIAVTFLLDPLSPSYEKDLLLYTHDIFTFVKKYKGGISAIGGDGLSRTPYLPLFYGEAMIEVFKKIKLAWDPFQIFNPSKKTALALQYLQDHIRRT